MENPCVHLKYTYIEDLFCLKIQPNYLLCLESCTSSFHLVVRCIRILLV